MDIDVDMDIPSSVSAFVTHTTIHQLPSIDVDLRIFLSHLYPERRQLPAPIFGLWMDTPVNSTTADKLTTTAMVTLSPNIPIHSGNNCNRKRNNAPNRMPMECSITPASSDTRS